MAAPDARRSSRARLPQSQSQNSSTTSSTSGRAERSTRSFIAAGSPHKSTPTASLSSEPLEDTITAEDSLATRRRTRGNAEEREKDHSEMANGDDDVQEEDEAVRCICGFDDYPGPPPFEEDSKHKVKDSTDIDPIFTTTVNDDTAGLFVQCDVCKVWQHGACVGIMTEESSPDEYFCEECREDLHKIFTASNGQRYSHYLPLKKTSGTTSRAVSMHKEETKSPKEKETRSARNANSLHAGKRRSTMNSREAAYDEAEALRRAIEASKEDARSDEPEGAVRRGKRGRSDSVEKQDGAKRPRTSSRSVSPTLDTAIEDSDDLLSNSKNGLSKSKSRSSAAARNQRAEQAAEKEERDRMRAEAANKRKGRAERRRADDSDPSDEVPLANRNATVGPVQLGAKANTSPEGATLRTADPQPPSSQPTPDTPPGNSAQSRNDRKRSHKKKGRNQYTRDRDGQDEESPARSQSRDIQKDDGITVSKMAVGDSASKSASRNKGGLNSKVTMTDMKRRATALLDFISRTQVELAGENGDDKTPAGDSASSVAENPADKQDAAPADTNGDGVQPKDFKGLNCIEMMDSLTRRLVKWQQEYAA